MSKLTDEARRLIIDEIKSARHNSHETTAMIVRLYRRLEELEDELEKAHLARIEAQNPGIDIDRVKQEWNDPTVAKEENENKPTDNEPPRLMTWEEWLWAFFSRLDRDATLSYLDDRLTESEDELIDKYTSWDQEKEPVYKHPNTCKHIDPDCLIVERNEGVRWITCTSCGTEFRAVRNDPEDELS